MNNIELNYKKASKNLFEKWKNTDLHKESVFIADGVVCPDIWFKNIKRPLYLLKEAYGGKQDWSLIDDYLVKNDKISRMWNRVSAWTKGMLNTNHEYIEKFDPDDAIFSTFNNQYLRNIAVINIKKSGGEKASSYKEILEYAKKDNVYLLEQLKICDPNIIICGYTIDALKIILEGYGIKKVRNKHLFYFTEINNHRVIILDYWHPANLFPDIMNYYGLMHSYQQALIAVRNKVAEDYI